MAMMNTGVGVRRKMNTLIMKLTDRWRGEFEWTSEEVFDLARDRFRFIGTLESSSAMEKLGEYMPTPSSNPVRSRTDPARRQPVAPSHHTIPVLGVPQRWVVARGPKS